MGTPEVDAFAQLAEEYCHWAEEAPGEPSIEAATAERYLARLYAAALALPPAPSPSDESTQSAAHPGWRGVFRRFAALPFNYYSVADPHTLTRTEILVGDLADDLADIWRDLRPGTELYRAGKTEDAALEWRFHFDCHWGRHAAAGLLALRAWAQGNDQRAGEQQVEADERPLS